MPEFQKAITAIAVMLAAYLLVAVLAFAARGAARPVQWRRLKRWLASAWRPPTR